MGRRWAHWQWGHLVAAESSCHGVIICSAAVRRGTRVKKQALNGANRYGDGPLSAAGVPGFGSTTERNRLPGLLPPNSERSKKEDERLVDDEGPALGSDTEDSGGKWRLISCRFIKWMSISLNEIK